MKKSFPLEIPNRKTPRVVEAIKNDLRKYLKRERRKALPEGADFCDFDCRVGQGPDSSEAVHVTELNERVDVAAKENWPSVYIEILAKPGYRTRKPTRSYEEAGDSDSRSVEE